MLGCGERDPGKGTMFFTLVFTELPNFLSLLVALMAADDKPRGLDIICNRKL